MRKLTQADYLRTPWKNGGGETVQLVAFPAGAGLNDFVWRISMATVAVAGSFSRFPGVDRTLAVLNGTIELDIEEVGRRLLDPRSEPLRFAGELAVAAQPIGGPVTDLNVMTRREHAHHSVRRVGPGGLVQCRDITALLAIEAARLEGAASISLEPTELLIVEGSAPVAIAGGLVLVANLSLR